MLWYLSLCLCVSFQSLVAAGALVVPEVDPGSCYLHGSVYTWTCPGTLNPSFPTAFGCWVGISVPVVLEGQAGASTLPKYFCTSSWVPPLSPLVAHSDPSQVFMDVD